MIDSDAFWSVFEVLFVLTFLSFLLGASDGEYQLSKLFNDLIELGLLVEGDTYAILLPEQFLMYRVHLSHG